MRVLAGLGQGREHEDLVPGLLESLSVRLDDRLHAAERGQVVVGDHGDAHSTTIGRLS